MARLGLLLPEHTKNSVTDGEYTMITFDELNAQGDEITELSLHKCLMWLEFEKEKGELEAKMIKQAYSR